jgi:hypothetical protein
MKYLVRSSAIALSALYWGYKTVELGYGSQLVMVSQMIANPKFFYISPEDYLEGERESPIKHEYKRGLVYAMVGAKKPHVIM